MLKACHHALYALFKLKLDIPTFSGHSTAWLWYVQTQENIETLFPFFAHVAEWVLDNVTTILGALKCCFMGPHSHYWVLTTRSVHVCWCKLHCLGVSNFMLCWSDIINTCLSMLCWVTKSCEAWEQTSKLGVSEWHFIWLLIRMIPLYLRDCNPPWVWRLTLKVQKYFCSYWEVSPAWFKHWLRKKPIKPG